MNRMKEIAEMFGKELGEEFYIKELLPVKFKFTKNGLYSSLATDYKESIKINGLLSGYYTIMKMPKITDAERTILECLPEQYEWIARDEVGMLSIFDIKPEKDKYSWYIEDMEFEDLTFFKDIFKFIKWSDKEPYNIKELLEQ